MRRLIELQVETQVAVTDEMRFATIAHSTHEMMRFAMVETYLEQNAIESLRFRARRDTSWEPFTFLFDLLMKFCCAPGDITLAGYFTSYYMCGPSDIQDCAEVSIART